LEDCIERARSYALERHQFKRPLASFQLVQKKLVDAHVEAGLGLLASLQVSHFTVALLAPLAHHHPRYVFFLFFF